MLQINSKNYVETPTHIYFWSSVYSQWHSCRFTNKAGVVFTSAEQYMMWCKASIFNDYEVAQKVLETSDPKRQKALGRLVRGYDDGIWSTQRLGVVIDGNYLKFTQSEVLRDEILNTGGRVFVEGSPYDIIWGVGLHCTDEKILDESNWRGENLLGRALVVVRDRMRVES